MTVLIAYQISPKNIIYQRMSCLSLIHDSRSSRCVSISRSPTLYLSLIIFGRSSIPTRSEISVFILLYRFLYLRPAHGKNFFNSIRHGTILSSCNPYFKLYRRLHDSFSSQTFALQMKSTAHRISRWVSTYLYFDLV